MSKQTNSKNLDYRFLRFLTALVAQIEICLSVTTNKFRKELLVILSLYVPTHQATEFRLHAQKYEEGQLVPASGMYFECICIIDVQIRITLARCWPSPP